jgi:hypothetical protein
MTITLSNVLFSAMMVVNEPQRIVEGTLTATLMKPSSGDPLTIELNNAVESYT